MNIGKIPNDILKRIILDKLPSNRSDILLRPAIGEDCAALDFGEYACILSSDPITGTASQVGELAVNVSCNDIASCGCEPMGILMTLLAPPGTTEDDISQVMSDAGDACRVLGVDIIGGHTEITNAVNRIVIITTAVGRMHVQALVSTAGANPGDCVIMTKWAGIEGTSIIASDHYDLLQNVFGTELVDSAKQLIKHISVVKEGIIAGSMGATAMHDITEGGVLGALWEVSAASGVGMRIDADSIEVRPETGKICSYYSINPLKLISSGSMLITIQYDRANLLIDSLKSAGINASIIGIATESLDLLIYTNKEWVKIDPPDADELYKVSG